MACSRANATCQHTNKARSDVLSSAPSLVLSLDIRQGLPRLLRRVPFSAQSPKTHLWYHEASQRHRGKFGTDMLFDKVFQVETLSAAENRACGWLYAPRSPKANGILPCHIIGCHDLRLDATVLSRTVRAQVSYLVDVGGINVWVKDPGHGNAGTTRCCAPSREDVLGNGRVNQCETCMSSRY